MSYIPDKGDIIWLQLNPQAGSEQAGHRPCLVVSPKLYNQFGLLIICPITNQTKGYRWEVPLDPEQETTGFVLTDQVKSLDWGSRNAQFKEFASSEVLNQVLQRIHIPLFGN